MMNVANLELCEELYELSGWQTDTAWWCWVEAHQDYEINNGQPKFPAYDLGYLLRELPRQVPNDDNGGSYYLDMHIVPGVDQPWTICYDNAFDQMYEVDAYADNPEDAACELAIKLFKQGVLKHE